MSVTSKSIFGSAFSVLQTAFHVALGAVKGKADGQLALKAGATAQKLLKNQEAPQVKGPPPTALFIPNLIPAPPAPDQPFHKRLTQGLGNFFPQAQQGFLQAAKLGLQHIQTATRNKAANALYKGTKAIAFKMPDILADYAANVGHLKTLTGDENLGGLLTQLADYLAAEIPIYLEVESPEAEDESTQNGFLQLLKTQATKSLIESAKNDPALIKSLMRALITKAGVNIARKLQKEGKPVSLLGVVSTLSMEIGENIQKSQETFNNALKIQDPKQQQAALELAALPTIDAFLKLAFPNGAQEFPVRGDFQDAAWSLLRSALATQITAIQRCVHAVSEKKLDPTPVQQNWLNQVLQQVKESIPPFFAVAENAATVSEAILTTCDSLGRPVAEQPLQAWLTAEIQKLGNLENPTSRLVWDWIGPKLDAVSAYLFAHLAAKGSSQEPIFPIILTLLKNLGKFDRNHRNAVEACEQTEGQNGQDPLNSQKYLDCFQPLLDSLKQSSGFSSLEPLILNVIGESGVKNTNALLLKTLAQYYKNPLKFLTECHKIIRDGSRVSDDHPFFQPLNTVLLSSKQRLRELLILEREGGPFSTDEGATEGTDQIENLCTVFAKRLTPWLKDQITEKINSNIGAIPNAFNTMSSLDFQERYLQKLLTSLFMQILANYLHTEKSAAQQVVAPEFEGIPIPTTAAFPFSKVLEKFTKILESHLHQDSENIKKAAAFSDSVEGIDFLPQEEIAKHQKALKDKKAEALRVAFSPLANALIDAISPAGADPNVIPYDFPFKSMLDWMWKDLRKEILPDFLASVYMDSTVWTREAEASKKIILDQANTPYIPEGCRVLGKWLSELIPSYFYQNQADWAEWIYDAIAKFLEKEGNSEGLSVNAYIQKYEWAIKKRLCEDLGGCCFPNGKFEATLRPFTKQDVEAALLKACSHLTVNINNVQGRDKQQQEKFMVNLGLNLLKVANSHFTALNNTAQSYGWYAAHQVPHKHFIAGFEENLHKGIPQTKEGLQARKTIKKALKFLEKERRLYAKLQDPVKKKESREKIRKAQAAINRAKEIQWKEREKFFKPLSENLIKLMGLNGPKDLAVPPQLQESLWTRFTETLLPTVLANVFETITHPATRMTMMMTGLENLNLAMDGISDGEEAENALARDDLMQRNLNKACGELILELVKLVPHSMIQAIFKIDKLKILERQSAELVGKAVRDYLGRDLNVLKWIDKGIKSGLPSLYPGTWDEGRFVIDEKAPWLFPLNEEAVEQREREWQAQMDTDAKRMRKMMVATTRRIMSESMAYSWKIPLFKLKLVWEACVRFVFGEYGDRVIRFFQELGENTVFKLIEAGCSAFTYPFRTIFWFFMEIHIGRKADHVIKSLQLDIHENLLYQLTDTFIATITGAMKAEDSEEALKSYLDAADNRSKQEILEGQKVIEGLTKLGLRLAAQDHKAADKQAAQK